MVEWITSDGLVDYDQAVAFMEDRAAAISEGSAEECIWLVEHPPLYTAGTSAKREDLTDPAAFRCMIANAAASTPIMGPDNGSSMSC